MKLIRTTLFAAALGLSTAAMAADDVTPPGAGPYAALAVGGDFYNGNSLIDPSSHPSTLKLRDGLSLSGAGGYKWDQWIRTELELSHSDSKAKDVNAINMPLLGSQNDNSMMANLLIDIPTGTRWTPFVGGGGGVSWLKLNNVQPVGSPTVVNGTSSKFAWQGIAGVALTVAPNWEVLAEYRYKGSNGHTYATNVPGSFITKYNDRANIFLMGLRVTFGAKPMAAAAAAPAPAPPPPPAPMARTAPPPAPAPAVPEKFLVFFDYDKSNLRNDAEKIVAQAAQYAKTNGKATINATGYTDTMGSVAYNMALSERRAKAVQKELEKLGIPESEIAIHWKGKSDLLVQTKDHVKEPQNRRVEIILE